MVFLRDFSEKLKKLFHLDYSPVKILFLQKKLWKRSDGRSDVFISVYSRHKKIIVPVFNKHFFNESYIWNKFSIIDSASTLYSKLQVFLFHTLFEMVGESLVTNQILMGSNYRVLVGGCGISLSSSFIICLVLFLRSFFLCRPSAFFPVFII